MTENQIRVIAYLKVHGSKTLRDVATMLGGPERDARLVLGLLIRAGQLVPDGVAPKHYRLGPTALADLPFGVERLREYNLDDKRMNGQRQVPMHKDWRWDI